MMQVPKEKAMKADGGDKAKPDGEEKAMKAMEEILTAAAFEKCMEVNMAKIAEENAAMQAKIDAHSREVGYAMGGPDDPWMQVLDL